MFSDDLKKSSMPWPDTRLAGLIAMAAAASRKMVNPRRLPIREVDGFKWADQSSGFC